MSQMLKSSGAMSVATLVSRILGMGREILYANFMGAGLVASAFKLAFMVPNLFRRLLGEGALTAAFIPIFKEKEKMEGEGPMWHSANAVISGLVVAATVIIAVVVIGITLVLRLDAPPSVQAQRATSERIDRLLAGSAPLATNALAPAAPARSDSASESVPQSFYRPRFPDPGFLAPDRRLMFELLRLMFPYMLLVCMAAIFMGMLNARGHFFLPAMGATVLNTVMILVVLFVAPHFGRTLDKQIYAVAVGVLVAGTAQTFYQVPTLWREGFRFHWVKPWRDPTVPLVVRKMIPGMMGVAAFQLNVLLTQSIAYAIDPHLFAWFDYSVRLMELPQGIFGISLATYLLPTLSGLAAEKKFPEFRETLGQGLGYLVFGNAIASVLLVVLAEPIVRLLFEHGKFSAVDTRQVGYALACLAPGLIAFSVVNILARAFYALGDTKTPMKISTVCLAFNLLFTVWLIHPFAQGGMGVANTLSALLNVGLLSYALRRKLKTLSLGALRRMMLNMIGAALFAGEIAWLLHRFWEHAIGHRGFVPRLGAVFIPMAGAALVYGLVLLWLRTPQARDFYELLMHRLRRRS